VSDDAKHTILLQDQYQKVLLKIIYCNVVKNVVTIGLRQLSLL